MRARMYRISVKRAYMEGAEAVARDEEYLIAAEDIYQARQMLEKYLDKFTFVEVMANVSMNVQMAGQRVDDKEHEEHEVKTMPPLDVEIRPMIAFDVSLLDETGLDIESQHLTAEFVIEDDFTMSNVSDLCFPPYKGDKDYKIVRWISFKLNDRSLFVVNIFQDKKLRNVRFYNDQVVFKKGDVKVKLEAKQYER